MQKHFLPVLIYILWSNNFIIASCLQTLHHWISFSKWYIKHLFQKYLVKNKINKFSSIKNILWLQSINIVIEKAKKWQTCFLWRLVALFIQKARIIDTREKWNKAKKYCWKAIDKRSKTNRFTQNQRNCPFRRSLTWE